MLRKISLLFVLIISLVSTIYAQTNKPAIYINHFLSGSSGELVIFDGTTLTEIGRIPIDGIPPYDVVLSPDNKFAFIEADPRFTTGIKIVDLSKKQVIKTILVNSTIDSLK